MTSIFVLFILSLGLSILLTPVVGWVARRYRLLDQPSERKVHKDRIPRAGGVAIFLAFLLPFSGAFFYYTDLLSQILTNESLIWLISGATIVFVLGLLDDIHSLPSSVKLIVQIVAAIVACKGGIMISGVTVASGAAYIFAPWLSLGITVFWFLLIVNAINLIDGLDGLAAGLCFFASLVLLVLSLMAGRFFVAMGFASLAGACLGFLRYNFNPATIFLGDSGSYFLGYMLAGLSVLGAMKGQTIVAILIPIVALGVPIIDTIIAPLRRFIRGKKIFAPDSSHIHHRLMRLGLDHRNAVLLLYGFSIILGAFALILVNIRDARAAIILALLWVAVFVGIRKLGYMEYLTMDKFYGWLWDLKDVTGISQKRRNFLSLQMDMNESRSIEELWEKICVALEILKFDRSELYLHSSVAGCTAEIDRAHAGTEEERRREPGSGWKDSREAFHFAVPLGNGTKRVWTRGYYRRQSDIAQEGFLTIEMPLMNGKEAHLGTLRLIKDLGREHIDYHTLRRVEQLRRTITGMLRKLVPQHEGHDY